MNYPNESFKNIYTVPYILTVHNRFLNIQILGQLTFFI